MLARDSRLPRVSADVRCCFLALILSLLSTIGFAGGKINTSQFSGLAIHGYDPVAYFEQGKAVPGNRGLTYTWQGTIFAFASESNRDLFSHSPQKFIPQFGGYCAYAAANDAISDADPTAWQIVEGKLYLNYDNRVQRTWAGELKKNLKLANDNWPRLSQSLE